jgi:hypothetical protein
MFRLAALFVDTKTDSCYAASLAKMGGRIQDHAIPKGAVSS